MKRRDTFRMIPLALAGAGVKAGHAAPIESAPRTVDTGEPRPLCLEYPKIIMNMLEWVRQNQSGNIMESAYAISRTLRKKGTFWINWDQGHSTRGEMFPGRDGMPEFLNHGYDPGKAKDGDVLMACRILSEAGFEDLKKKDVFVIGAPSPWSGDAAGFRNVREDIRRLRIGDYSDIWIETNITSIGPILTIPGMPAPIGPVSGPLYMTIMWMILADVCRVCTIEGVKVSIMGDGPKLSGRNVTWIEPGRPLADIYLDTVNRELEMVGSELGDIRRMASMAVDSLLGGGSVYYYSRYPETFRGEATGRRGGLAFAKGISDGDKVELTPKDCVIMGVFKPDDDVDLRHLDMFKKAGVRIASIGPIMRDFNVPEGRCVHRETEVHAGRMSDTLGLFAIPGIDRKVCPTSGISMIAVHWAVSIEIIEQIKARTGGNVPGVHHSGVLHWGNEFNSRVRAIARERGY